MTDNYLNIKFIIAFIIIIIIIVLLYYVLYNNKSKNYDLYIRKRICAVPNQRIDLFNVNYTQIISSLAVTTDRNCDIQLYVVGNDPNTGQIVTTKLFDKSIPSNTTGYVAVIRDGEVVDNATFYVIAECEAILDIVAVGFTL